MSLVRVYFRNYYRNPDDPPFVPSIEKREIAYQPLDRDVMIRHLSFRDLDSFRKFLVKTVPLHVYYSTAYYAYPDNPNMDKKLWEGADLVFDIDADHLDSPSCREASENRVLTIECLEDALQETLKLLDVLEHELGLSRQEYYVTFSGHRGFHVHVEAPHVRELSQEERREILDYLLARAFRVERFVDEKMRLLIGPGLEGVGGRIWNVVESIVDDEDLRMRAAQCRRILKRQLKRLESLNDRIAEKLRVRVDEVVTLDVKRLIRVPNSLHGKTGMRVVLLSRQDLEKGAYHILNKAVPRVLARGRLKVLLRAHVKVSNVLGFSLDGVESLKPVDVPPYVAIYLIRQGVADLVE